MVNHGSNNTQTITCQDNYKTYTLDPAAAQNELAQLPKDVNTYSAYPGYFNSADAGVKWTASPALGITDSAAASCDADSDDNQTLEYPVLLGANPPVFNANDTVDAGPCRMVRR